MLRHASAALAPSLLLAVTVPASAEPLSLSPEPAAKGWRLPIEDGPHARGPGLSLPVINYVAPGGALEIKRGIVAGIDVAPNAIMGIGLFKILPKERRPFATDDPLDKPKSRKSAAVGLSIRV